MTSRERPRLHVVREDEDGLPDDADLLVAHLAGDAQAFSALVRRYERPVYRLALRYARDADEAEDLAQRTFLRVLAHAGDLRPGQPFAAYLFRIAANLCKNHLRDRARLVFGLPLEAAAPDAGASPDALEAQQRRSKMREALARLPQRQRQVVSLRVDAELPFAQIAEALGITENNAKVNFHYAVKRLQKLVGAEEV